MNWESILKNTFEYNPTDNLIDEPFTREMKWEGKDYYIYDNEKNPATPNGVLYVYKTYHKPTGTLSYPIIKLYLDDEDKIREWTDDDQKEFDMEVDSHRFDVWTDAKSKEKFVRDNK